MIQTSNARGDKRKIRKESVKVGGPWKALYNKVSVELGVEVWGDSVNRAGGVATVE